MNTKVLTVLGKKALVSALMLMAMLALIIAVTGIPMDFGVQYFDGETVIHLTAEDLVNSIKENFKLFGSGQAFSLEIKGETTWVIFVRAAGRSLPVLFIGTVLSLLIGTLKGIIDSRKKHRGGTLKLLQSLIPLSIPDILIITLIQLGAMTLYHKAFEWPLLGVIPYFGDETALHALLPILSISLIPAAYLSRLVANTIEDGLSKPYILAARGKGCSLFRIITTHLRKQIQYTVLSAMPTLLGILFSSLVIVEQFFQFRGIGYHLIYFYTTTLVPDYEAGVAFSVFIVSMAFIYYGLFLLMNGLKQVLLPKIDSKKEG